MPIIFIHGVNTRDTDPGYHKDVAARTELLQQLVIEPLAAKDDRFKQIQIINPYWGKYGVEFKWHLTSLPAVHTLEHLGGDEETPPIDMLLVATARELAGERSDSTRLETLGSGESLFKRAAVKDLTRFIELLLLPLILSERRLTEGATTSDEEEGILQALLAIAAQEVAADPAVKTEVAAASEDDEVIDLLKERVQSRFQQLVQARLAAKSPTALPENQLESLGPTWLDELQSAIGELFDRAKNAPGRAATLPFLELWRDGLHRNLSRFLGDVFVYLKERGDKTTPGPIVSTILEAIKSAPKSHPLEPLIIITHSMGGNVLYDLLTYYTPELKIDVWVSVGGQVAQFEEMKLFQASDKTIGIPDKVKGLQPRVGYWLNVYDPADSLSFKASPVFADAHDQEYLTGVSALKAHNEYFGRASFYQLIREYIEKALL